MNNQIQKTYARTTSSGSGGAQPFYLKQTSMTNSVKTAVVILRGLDARITFAKAVGVCDDEDRAMAVGHAAMLAEVQGREDFIRGRDAEDVPPLLADVTELASAWADGWDAAGESLALAVCSCCNDGSGNPCPHHG